MRFKALAVALGVTLMLVTPFAFALALNTLGPVQALIRYPGIHGHTIVFEAGGSIWKVPERGRRPCA